MLLSVMSFTVAVAEYETTQNFIDGGVGFIGSHIDISEWHWAMWTAFPNMTFHLGQGQWDVYVDPAVWDSIVSGVLVIDYSDYADAIQFFGQVNSATFGSIYNVSGARHIAQGIVRMVFNAWDINMVRDNETGYLGWVRFSFNVIDFDRLQYHLLNSSNNMLEIGLRFGNSADVERAGGLYDVGGRPVGAGVLDYINFWQYFDNAAPSTFAILEPITIGKNLTIHTVTFDAGTGNNPPSQNVAEGQRAIRPMPNPQRQGYDFRYWAIDDGSGNLVEWNFNDLVLANMTLIAVWHEENKDPGGDRNFIDGGFGFIGSHIDISDWHWAMWTVFPNFAQHLGNGQWDVYVDPAVWDAIISGVFIIDYSAYADAIRFAGQVDMNVPGSIYATFLPWRIVPGVWDMIFHALNMNMVRDAETGYLGWVRFSFNVIDFDRLQYHLLNSPNNMLEIDIRFGNSADVERAGGLYDVGARFVGAIHSWDGVNLWQHFNNASPSTFTIFEPITIGRNVTVTFDANGGTSEPATQIVLFGGRAATPTHEPTKDGYNFRYWAVDDGSGNLVEWDFNDPITDNAIFVAVWDSTNDNLGSGFLWDEHFVWIGSESVLAGNAVNGQIVNIGYNLYVNPRYWDTGVSAILAFGFEELEGAINFNMSNATSNQFGITMDFDNNEVTLNIMGFNHTADPITGFVGRVNFGLVISDIDLLRTLIKESPNGQLPISVRYGVTPDAQNPGEFYEDAAYLPRGWRLFPLDAVQVRNMTPGHTYFAPATISLGYGVNFHANGGEGSMLLQNIFYGVDTTLRANAFTNGEMIFQGWSTNANGTGTRFADEAIVTFEDMEALADSMGQINLFAIWTENIVILAPSDVGDGFGGFTILKGRWAEETTATITFLVRINDSVAEEVFLSRLNRMLFTAAPRGVWGPTPFSMLTHSDLNVTATNIGNVVEVDGVEYREINLWVTDTLRSGIVDFRLNFVTANNSETLASATHRVLIPGDVNKDGQVNSIDHAIIFSIMRGETAMPARRAAGDYVFELADVNGDGQINSLDHAVIFNMMRGIVPTN